MAIMAIGERIHFFRTMRGMTQKYLGMALGFPEKSADVRLAQYENGSRTPKADVTAALAQVLDVSPKALDVPDIDSYTGLMHTLFTLEDRYGLEVCECEDEVHLRVHIHKGRDAAELHRMLSAWGALAAKLKAGEITKEEYDRWRYRYPELDTSGQWHKITPSQELSDLLLADLKEHNKNKQNGFGICYHFAIKQEMRFSKSECFQGFSAHHIHFFLIPTQSSPAACS